MELIFWILIGLVTYTYFGYPLLLVFIARIKKIRIEKKEIYPYVSIVITAHNEEKNIRLKLENTFELDYPKEKLEIIVASDASDDKTECIIKEFADKRVRLLTAKIRVGKTKSQNQAVKEAKGEIILFSDATTIYSKQALKKIVSNFADPKVGAVGGELVYLNKNNSTIGEGEGLYWRYEKFLKKQESKISSLIGVSGCCYAVRKELYDPINPDLISDFVIAQIIYKKRKKVIYEPEAISYEETNVNSEDEFNMRVRVAIRTLYGLWRMKSLLNPFKYGFFSIQLISHKILRYLIPIFLFSLFLINLIIYLNTSMWLYKIILNLQIFFYISAILGCIFQKKKTYLYIPFYFFFTNFALLVGLLKFLKGERQIVWNSARS